MPLLAQPVITHQPANQVLTVGGTLTLGVTAGGGTLLAYQWFKDGRLLLGATNSTLTVTNAGVTNSGTYYVVVTNSSGMVISLPALVAVGNPSLLAWGYNTVGQLGNGTWFNAYLPISVASNVVATAAGYWHSLFVTTDGTLWTVGDNDYGQLGNATNGSYYTLPISVASNVVAVAAGYYHSLFVKTDGTLWAMGYNADGQLGNGTTNDVHTPISVASNVVAVAAGFYHSLFLKNDGTLWTMGDNYNGQLGNGTSSNAFILPISMASNVVAVAAGGFHSLLVKNDGTLWSMGDNGLGQLGNGTTNDAHTPISVASNVVAAAGGRVHSLFARADGTLWAVGNNYYGQLGNGTSGNYYTVPINVASNAVAVAAGEDHSLFVKNDGTLWAMGFNCYGQLGNGTTNDAHAPINMPHLSVANISPADPANHSLAIGLNYNATVTLGNLHQTYTGMAISVTASTTPPGLMVVVTYNGSPFAPTNVGSYTVVGTISDPFYVGSATNTLVIAMPIAGPANQVVAVGGTLTLGVTAGVGTPLTYQWFKDGRLLLGATNSTLTVTNAGVTNSGTYYVVATNGSGMVISLPASVLVGNPSLLAWGYNRFGQLGNGNTNNAFLPVSVASNVVAAAGGYANSLFVRSDGILWAMGFNNDGQLGNGTNGNYYYTLPISVASNVVAVAAGFSHSLFVKNDGTLWAMGYNYYGQLGNGTTTNAVTPNCVASNVVAVAAGDNFSLFVTMDGTLWAMGENLSGQLGNGTSDNHYTVPISVARNVVAVAAGQEHSLFVTMDGTLWAVGENGWGQLGNGTTANAYTPISVASNVMAVAAGEIHSLFVTKDGIVWAMGQNTYGQLGNGTTNDAHTPISVASNVMAVVAGCYHSLFVKNDGTLWAMGWAHTGELGNGATYSFTNLPVVVPHLTVANIFPAHSAFHSLAMGLNNTAAGISLAGGIPTLSFSGIPGNSYNVARSTNLTSWSAIWTTNEPAYGVFQFADPSAPQPNAFYRLQPNF
jgi:alpha-tubulin suppressor-like RCC1 family protein